MGLFTFIKERLSYLVVGLIAIAILAFIVSDVVRNGTPFLRESQNQIGTIGGEKVTYDQFSEKLKDKEDQFKAQYRQASLPEQTKHFVNDQAWNELVTNTLLNKQIDKAGLQVVKNSSEDIDMIKGSNPDPQIKQAFADPATGQYDRSKLDNFLSSMDKDPSGESRKRWNKFQNELLESHSVQKFLNLIKGGVYVTQLELKQSYNVPEKCNVEYAVLDYTQIADNKTNLSDQDLKTYYTNHSYLYQNPEELRSFDYVVFQSKPSSEDSSFAKKDIEKLAIDFKASKDDSLFVSLNADSKNPIRFYKKAQLPHPLDSSLVNMNAGSVYGPYFQNGAYKLAKLISVKDLPDSVKSRHILLSDAPQGGGAPVNYPALMKKADSLKNVILAGGNFAMLAGQYSVDKGSAVKGGELGYAPMGAFVKPFQDAVFYGKIGEFKIVQTQFGVHLIQIEDQKNIGKSYEVAMIDRPFHPSTKTQQDNYSKATGFLSGVNGHDFAITARKLGFTVRSSVDTKAGDPQINGVDNSRKVIQWAFGTKVGTLSEVFDLGETAVVAKLSEVKPKGLLDYDKVKFQVQAAAIKEKKGDLLGSQILEVKKSSHSLAEISAKLKIPIATADSINFSSPYLVKNLTEPKVVGAIFGLSLNTVSKPIAGERGVYIVQLKNKFTELAPPDKIAQSNATQGRGNIAENDAMEALKKLGNVVDNRSKFF